MIKFKLKSNKPKSVLTETKLAYSDCQSQSEAAYQKRNLHFRASKSVSPVDACVIMCKALKCDRHEDGYNEFRPSYLGLLPVGSMVTLAREGSVCIYVTLPEGTQFTETDSRLMQADEYHVEDDGTIRLWWD